MFRLSGREMVPERLLGGPAIDEGRLALSNHPELPGFDRVGTFPLHRRDDGPRPLGFERNLVEVLAGDRREDHVRRQQSHEVVPELYTGRAKDLPLAPELGPRRIGREWREEICVERRAFLRAEEARAHTLQEILKRWAEPRGVGTFAEVVVQSAHVRRALTCSSGPPVEAPSSRESLEAIVIWELEPRRVQ